MVEWENSYQQRKASLKTEWNTGNARNQPVEALGADAFWGDCPGAFRMDAPLLNLVK